jgi:hypothetical protein
VRGNAVVGVSRVRRAAVVLLIAVGLLAGCSSTPQTSAVVHGVLGGQEVPGMKTLHPPPFVATAGVVHVVKGSILVATLKVGTSGRFQFRVPPGAYRLEGIPSPFAGWACNDPHVRATANAAVAVSFDCRRRFPEF